MILSSIFFLSGLNTHTHSCFLRPGQTGGRCNICSRCFLLLVYRFTWHGIYKSRSKSVAKKKKKCYNYSYSTTPSLRSDLSCSWKPSSTAHWYDNSIWQVAWQCTDKSWNLKLSAKCIGCAINTEQAQKLEQKAKSKASSIHTTSAETPQQTAKKKKKKKKKRSSSSYSVN